MKLLAVSMAALVLGACAPAAVATRVPATVELPAVRATIAAAPIVPPSVDDECAPLPVDAPPVAEDPIALDVDYDAQRPYDTWHFDVHGLPAASRDGARVAWTTTACDSLGCAENLTLIVACAASGRVVQRVPLLLAGETGEASVPRVRERLRAAHAALLEGDFRYPLVKTLAKDYGEYPPKPQAIDALGMSVTYAGDEIVARTDRGTAHRETRHWRVPAWSSEDGISCAPRPEIWAVYTDPARRVLLAEVQYATNAGDWCGAPERFELLRVP